MRKLWGWTGAVVVAACSTYGGSETPDAGVADAGADVATTHSFCEKQTSAHDFCSDFDDGRFPLPWDEAAPLADAGAESKVFLDGEPTTSAPYAVHFVAAPSTQAFAFLRKNVRQPTTSIAVGLSFGIANFGGNDPGQARTASFGLVTFRLPPPPGLPNPYNLIVYVNGDATLSYFESPVPPATNGRKSAESKTHLPLGGYQRADVKLTIGATSSTLTASIGGVPIDIGSFTVSAQQFLGPVQVFVGDDKLQGNDKEWSVRVDDVTIDVDR